MKANDLYSFVLKNIESVVKTKETQKISQLILENYFNCTLIDILKNTEVIIKENVLTPLIEKIKDRLLKNEPIQYIIGKTIFLDCQIFVNKNVLIPRQETEEMVYNIIKNDLSGKKIIDICSGSGCIAISIKKKYNLADVTCIDISKEAIEVAKKNATLNKTEISFLNIDIFDKKIMNIDNYDIIISNPPYIPDDQKEILDKKITLYEPHISLFVEHDNPLKFYKRLLFIIEEKLNSQGMFFLEINEFFANDILSMFDSKNFYDVTINKDLNGKYRWIKGKKI